MADSLPLSAKEATGQSEAEAKLFIYNHESGNKTDRVNYLNCVGIGQACPFGAKPALLAACPNWQIDYACQDQFFTNYMHRRYGTWSNAKTFWLSRVPVNGRDAGNWW